MDKSTPFTHPPDDWVPEHMRPENLQAEFTKQVAEKIAKEKDAVMRMRLDSFSVATIIADLIERNRKLEANRDDIVKNLEQSYVREGALEAQLTEATSEPVYGCTWPTGKCQCLEGDQEGADNETF